MPDTRLTKERLKNHWAYSKKIYIFMTLVCVGLASIIFTMVNNHLPPNNKLVGVAFVESYADTASLAADTPKLLSLGKAYDENLAEVTFLNIQYSGSTENEMDYYGAQLYQVHLGSGDYDIFMQGKELTDFLRDENSLVALDTLPCFELFTEKYKDALVWSEVNVGKDDENPQLEEHCYSVDISSMTRLISKNVFYTQGKYASIIKTSANPDTSLYILYQMLELYTEPAVQ